MLRVDDLIQVLIHYPTEKMDSMVGHLCDIACEEIHVQVCNSE